MVVLGHFVERTQVNMIMGETVFEENGNMSLDQSRGYKPLFKKS